VVFSGFVQGGWGGFCGGWSCVVFFCGGGFWGAWFWEGGVFLGCGDVFLELFFTSLLNQ